MTRHVLCWDLTKLPVREGVTNIAEVCGFLISPLVFLAVVLGVVYGTTGDCDEAIREWLKGLVVAMCISIAGSGVFIIISSKVKANNQALQMVGYVFYVFKVLLVFFYLVWDIVGSVWLYSSIDCNSDWEAGYVLTLILLTIGYTLALMICLLLLVLLIRVSVEPTRGAAMPTEMPSEANIT